MTCQQMDWEICKKATSLIPALLWDIARLGKGVRHSIVSLCYVLNLITLSASDCLAHAFFHEK